jgi:DNA-binding NarL/FixJ family response regulator
MNAPTAGESKRVVIVDDHPLIRQGLGRLLSIGNRFIVCGEAGTADEALQVLRETKPDLAIVDISLPDMDGIELSKKIAAEFPASKILVLSMHDDPGTAARALEAGARGYMVKQDAVEKIEMALDEVLQGRRYLSPSIAKDFA